MFEKGQCYTHKYFKDVYVRVNSVLENTDSSIKLQICWMLKSSNSIMKVDIIDVQRKDFVNWASI